MNAADKLSQELLALLYAATLRGAARTMPLMPIILRAKRGKKVAVRDGGYAHDVGRVLIALPDEAILNLKASEDAMDMWMISRVRREVANEFLGGAKAEPQIVRPGLVGPDGKPL